MVLKSLLTEKQKNEICKLYLTNKYSWASLWRLYWVKNTVILYLLHKRWIKIVTNMLYNKKYTINENYFDNIDCEEKAYILWLLYSDWYNNTDTYRISLVLRDKDKYMLDKINNLLQSTRKLYLYKKQWNCSDVYDLCINNKHMSQTLNKLWMHKAKTYTLTPQLWLDNELIRHFIRWYWDGDGYIHKPIWSHWCCSVTWTECMCIWIMNNIWVNWYLYARSPENNNNIRTLNIHWNNHMKIVCKYLYWNCSIYLKRKKDAADYRIGYKKETRKCTKEWCNEKHFGKWFCRKHYLQSDDAKAKQKIREIRYLDKKRKQATIKQLVWDKRAADYMWAE